MDVSSSHLLSIPFSVILFPSYLSVFVSHIDDSMAKLLNIKYININIKYIIQYQNVVYKKIKQKISNLSLSMTDVMYFSLRTVFNSISA